MAFCVVVDKFFNYSAPFLIPSVDNRVIVFFQKRRIAVRPPRFPIFQRRSATKNGMAAKTSDSNFSYIVKIITIISKQEKLKNYSLFSDKYGIISL